MRTFKRKTSYSAMQQIVTWASTKCDTVTLQPLQSYQSHSSVEKNSDEKPFQRKGNQFFLCVNYTSDPNYQTIRDMTVFWTQMTASQKGQIGRKRVALLTCPVGSEGACCSDKSLWTERHVVVHVALDAWLWVAAETCTNRAKICVILVKQKPRVGKDSKICQWPSNCAVC